MKRNNSTGLYLRGGTYWMRFTHNGIYYRRSTETSDRKIAAQIIETIKAQITLGQYVPAEETGPENEYTFAELVTKHDEWAAPRHKAWKESGKCMSNHLSICLGEILVRDFTARHVEQFQSAEIARGKSPAYINRQVTLLKSMFTKAVDWDMCGEDVLRKVRKAKALKGVVNRLRYLSQDECRTLIDKCESHLKPIVSMALNTGMRKGEILGLKWDNVDLKHGFILLDKTKNGERREIPIDKTLRATFTAIARRLDLPYVFFNPDTDLPYGDIKNAFNRAVRKAGIKDFHFHDLRHTFASHLVMAGVDITTVSKLLGHKSLTMTLRYSHLAPNHLQNAVNMLNITGEEKRTAYLLHSAAE